MQIAAAQGLKTHCKPKSNLIRSASTSRDSSRKTSASSFTSKPAAAVKPDITKPSVLVKPDVTKPVVVVQKSRRETNVVKAPSKAASRPSQVKSTSRQSVSTNHTINMSVTSARNTSFSLKRLPPKRLTLLKNTSRSG